MNLLIQPGDGVRPLVKAIEKAKKSVEIVIFRFDRPELEKALVEAVERGVFVHALIAFTNRGGEEKLRELESNFLAKGVTVARTSGDLVRYHSKFMIVDGKDLYVLAFNFTHLDIEHSRSFGVVTKNKDLVREAEKLFEADTKRQDYKGDNPRFIVSPANARKRLLEFIRGARRELLIYDPKISDREMLRAFADRARAGVKIRVVGKVAGGVLPVRALKDMRLHTRTILRDGEDAFIGSQSLRKLELDDRREVGVIFRDEKTLAKLTKIFENDWDEAKPSKKVLKRAARKTAKMPVHKTARKLARVVSKKVPVTPLVKDVTRALKKNGHGKLNKKAMEKTVKIAVQQSVKEAVEEAAREAVFGAVVAK